MKRYRINILVKYVAFALVLCIWTFLSEAVSDALDMELYGIIIILGLIYIPFNRWILNKNWINSIWSSYIIILISVTLVILIVDFGMLYSPDGISYGVRPFLQPLIRKIPFIKNEYDLYDFGLILRIVLNIFISILLFEIARLIIKKNNR